MPTPELIQNGIEKRSAISRKTGNVRDDPLGQEIFPDERGVESKAVDQKGRNLPGMRSEILVLTPGVFSERKKGFESTDKGVPVAVGFDQRGAFGPPTGLLKEG